MQHGVPQGVPRGDRGVRSAVSRGRRRRGRLLAAAGAEMDARVQRGGCRLASPAALGARVLEAAERVRPGGGDPGAEVAGEVQRDRASDVVGPPLWPGSAPAPRSRPDLSRRLGQRSISVAVPTGAEYVLVSPRHTGVDALGRRARRPLTPRRGLAPTAPRARAVRYRGATPTVRRRPRGGPRDVSTFVWSGHTA